MKRPPLLLLFCFVLLPVAGFVYAQAGETTAAQLFTQGNAEYQKGNFLSAEEQYRKILNSGIESGPVYYNLGNASFKQKRLGEAIYYWEKALQQMPADRETRENLQLANLLLVDRVEIPEDPLPLRLLDRFQGLLAIDQTCRLVLILFVAANILFTAYWLAGKTRSASYAFISALVVEFLFIVFTCSLSWKIYERAYREEAIVIERQADIRSGPGNDNIIVSRIHEGLKVRILGFNNGWYQISLPNGWNGWLPQDSLRLL